MAKKSHRQRYELFLAQLREARIRAGMTQVSTAEKLGVTQTFISKCELGERRLDVVDLIDFLDAYDVSATKFLDELQAKLDSTTTVTRQTKRR